MKVMQLSALLALIAMAMPSSVSAITDAAIKSQCQALSTCYKGGVSANTCSIQTEECPPCVTFTNSGCFDLTDGKCNFGSDCTKYWSGDAGGTSASSAGSSKGTSSSTSGTNNSGTSTGSKGNTSGTAGSAGVSTNSTTSTSNTTTASPSSSDTSSSKSDSGGTDMTVVFGIVGAAIGVIAVAIIFLALVRRSRAAEEDEDEMANTPPAMTKGSAGPSTTTNAASYAPYAQRAGPAPVPHANPTTPTNRVAKYYQDNAMPSPHGGRGGGGFGQQPQQQATVKTVRPAAAANAPTFFKPNAPAAPGPQARVVAPPPPPPQQQEQYNYYGQGATAVPTAAAYPQAEPLFTVHTGTEDPQLVRRVSSPRPRRESYEF